MWLISTAAKDTSNPGRQVSRVPDTLCERVAHDGPFLSCMPEQLPNNMLWKMAVQKIALPFQGRGTIEIHLLRLYTCPLARTKIILFGHSFVLRILERPQVTYRSCLQIYSIPKPIAVVQCSEISSTTTKGTGSRLQWLVVSSGQIPSRIACSHLPDATGPGTPQ